MACVLHFERHWWATHSASSVLSGRTLWSTMKAWGAAIFGSEDLRFAYNAASAIESTPPLIAKPAVIVREAHYKCSRLASPSLSKLDAPWLSTPIHCPKTLSKASRNSSFVIGKLVCELYHLVLRHAAAEEHFLNLRTLLLHINDAVTLNNKHREAKEREKQQVG